MILPTRISHLDMANKLNGISNPYCSDLYGLYLVVDDTSDDRGAEIKFYINGWAWGLRVFYGGHNYCFTKRPNNRATHEDLLSFVDHNTPECLDILLYVLPNPSILFDPDFPCRN